MYLLVILVIEWELPSLIGIASGQLFQIDTRLHRGHLKTVKIYQTIETQRFSTVISAKNFQNRVDCES